MDRRVAVIGGGFAGLSVACYLAQSGYGVTIYEKHRKLGGRARSLSENGFRFDMGPSWYWMPDVFERFFADFGQTVEENYTLKRLDPGFRIFYGANDVLDIPVDAEELRAILEGIEGGAAQAYERFMQDARKKYDIGMRDLVQTPCLHLTEFLSRKVLSGLMNMHLFTPFDRFVRRYFSHPKIIQLMEFPILFLGATPQNTPALYSLMNYAGLELGTWYPDGGMHKIIEAMERLAVNLGVKIERSVQIQQIRVTGTTATGLQSDSQDFEADIIVSSADYHHTEQTMLSARHRNYSEKYWESRTMAPSCLIFYLGISKPVETLHHHNLFFDSDFSRHAHEIYEDAKWPSDPLFYLCCPSKTDSNVAPPGCENVFVLMPLAAGVEDTIALRDRYFQIIMKRIEKITGESFEPHIIFNKSYCVNDFISDYGAYRGNAYGLANTLRQTALLKPTIKNKKIDNLYYTGQLTVPGPGVPPSIISGKIVAQQIIKEHPSN